MTTTFTFSQKFLLAHIEELGVGHFDPERRWIWKQDIREDAELAARYLHWLFVHRWF